MRPCPNFVESKSFFESNSPDFLALSETNLDDSTDSGYFSVRGYLPLIQKNYRPVSLLSVVSKVFEKLVNNSIVDHIEKYGLFSDFQYGFGLLDQLQIF